MSFRSALTQLSQLSVNGVQHNYDIDAVPESLSRAKLPALLVMPIEAEDDNSQSRESGQGFQAIAFSGGARSVEYRMMHLLLIAPSNNGKGIRSHLPMLIDTIDAYFTALAGDVLLNDNLAEPTQVQVEPGRFIVGGIEFIGCAFRHTWLIDTY